MTRDPTDRAATLHARAAAHNDAGDPRRARRACLAALPLFERHAGARHPDVANVCLELAVAEEQLARHGEALRHVRRALAIVTPLRSARWARPRSPSACDAVAALWAQALGQLGRLHIARGEYGPAEAAFRRLLDAAPRGLPPHAAATALNGLGMVCKYTARYAEAATLYRRALALTERARGPRHPAVASLLHNLGGLEHARGRFVRGEPYARRAVTIRERALGADHPHVAADVAALAAILVGLGRRREAEAMYRRAIGVYRRTLGPGHWEVGFNLGQLAALCVADGRLGEASRLYGRSLRMLSGAPRDPLLATVLWNAASLRRAQRRPAEAEALFGRALAIFRDTLGPRHPDAVACAADRRSEVVTGPRAAGSEPCSPGRGPARAGRRARPG